mmetsp:Transcript_1864/g.4000  ORF Transcript_1864/g.4000 Transcript_1864/m.4000 type:complete len:1000 (-) Transcript_1864:67-3066(-)
MQATTNLEGFLKKKSPNLLTGYQKRYFAIREGGKFLAYYKKAPKIGTTPKGIIKVENIKDLESTGENDFKFNIEERIFELRALNSEQKEMWIKNLGALIKVQKEQRQTQPTQPTQQQSAKGAKSWKTSNIDQTIVENLSRRSSVIFTEEAKAQPKDINQQIMAAKGIWPFISKLTPVVQRSYLISGFLSKRSKGAVKFFQKRWAVMVGSHSLFPNVDSEVVLTDADLPRWMRTNHLYYFKSNSPDDSSEMLGEIPARLCTVKVKDMSTSRDSGFTFILDMGTRMFHFNAETEEEMKQWITAVKLAQESAQEITSSVTGRPRQIRKLLEIFDRQGPTAFKDKLSSNFNKILGGLPDTVSSIQPVLDACTKLKPELIATIDGCLANNPRRQDVAELYTSIFHKMLCDLLKKHWKNLHSSMPEDDLLAFAEWVMGYDEQLREVEVTDDKLPNGAKVLCKTFCFRAFNDYLPRVVESIKTSYEIMPEVNDQGLLVSTCYYEVLGMLENYISKCKQFNIPFLTPFVLGLIKEAVFQYLYALQELLMREMTFNLDFLASICNVSTILADKLSYWVTINRLGHVAEASLSLDTLTSSLDMVCRLARRRLEEYFMEQLQRSMTTGITDTTMDSIFQRTTEKYSEIEPHMDGQLVTKLWTSLLKTSVDAYTTGLLRNTHSLKDRSILLFVECIKSDAALFKRHFSARVSSDLVAEHVERMKELAEYLESLPEQIKEVTIKLRSIFEGEFNEGSAKALIMIRNDLDDSEKQQAISQMREGFKSQITQRQSRLQSRQSVLMDIEGIQEGEDVAQDEINSLYKGKGEVHKVTASAAVVIEGNLHKKSGQVLVGYQQRFFAVRNGRLYWYKTQNSREACSSHDLSLLEDVSPKGNAGRFDVRVEGRILKLRAQTSEIRQQWIVALQGQQARSTRQSSEAFFQIKSTESLFEDFDNALDFKPNRLDAAKQASAVWPKKPRRSVARSLPSIEIPKPRAVQEPGSAFCFCFKRRS